jgi:metal-dependent amidase/aminoacylase/carboxypeptidase family protein
LSSEAIACSDYLADHPELSGIEYKSSKKIVNILKKYGFKIEMPFIGIQTSFKGSLKGEGKVKIAFLLEYDALPGIGHACGHCVSASISLLAGLGFSLNRDLLLGELDLIGTPAEETNGAKVDMLKKGVFDNYNLVIMIHMANRNSIRP